MSYNLGIPVAAKHKTISGLVNLGFVGSVNSILKNLTDIFEDFKCLSGQGTNENDIAFCKYSVIIEFNFYCKLLLKRAQ